MDFQLLSYDIIENILDITSNDIEIQIQLWINVLTNIKKFHILYLNINNKLNYEKNNNDTWLFHIDNLYTEIYLNNLTDIFEIYLDDHVKIIYILDNKLLYVSNILKNPNYYDLLKICHYIIYNFNIIKTIYGYYDVIFIKKFIKVYNKNNIDYYMIEFDWSIIHLENIYGIDNIIYKYDLLKYVLTNENNKKYILYENIYDILNKFKTNYNNIEKIREILINNI